MAKKWDLEKIRLGFERFIQENGRLPIAPEIDSLDYLPSSRQIQRAFGGLESIRNKLGYSETNFSKGEFRSKLGLRSNKEGRNSEIKLEKTLKEKFHEVFVHTEKIFDYENKNRVDFYIYSPDGNFGIDIFHTYTFRDLQKNVNIKINKYGNFNENLYLVVDSDLFTQQELDKYISNKEKHLPKNTFLITIDNMLKLIESKNIYNPPF